MEPVRFKIVVVEDDADDRFIIDEAFKAIGYEHEVKKVVDGDALMHYLEAISQAYYPAVIVLDNFLPRLDAADILGRLKDNPSYAAIPVVVYSTTMSPGRQAQLKAQGAYACLEKGNTEEEVVSVARNLRDLAESDAAIGTKLFS